MWLNKDFKQTKKKRDWMVMETDFQNTRITNTGKYTVAWILDIPILAFWGASSIVGLKNDNAFIFIPSLRQFFPIMAQVSCSSFRPWRSGSYQPSSAIARPTINFSSSLRMQTKFGCTTSRTTTGRYHTNCLHLLYSHFLKLFSSSVLG